MKLIGCHIYYIAWAFQSLDNRHHKLWLQLSMCCVIRYFLASKESNHSVMFLIIFMREEKNAEYVGGQMEDLPIL